MSVKSCLCGAPDCWDQGDYSWVSDGARWRGTVHGCATSIYWIHGKKIAEERHPPAFSRSLPELLALLSEWCAGLENPVITWSKDTGGGDVGLWIRSVREPVEADWARLQEVRARIDAEDHRQWMRLQSKFGAANDKQPGVSAHSS